MSESWTRFFFTSYFYQIFFFYLIINIFLTQVYLLFFLKTWIFSASSAKNTGSLEEHISYSHLASWKQRLWIKSSEYLRRVPCVNTGAINSRRRKERDREREKTLLRWTLCDRMQMRHPRVHFRRLAASHHSGSRHSTFPAWDQARLYRPVLRTSRKRKWI